MVPAAEGAHLCPVPTPLMTLPYGKFVKGYPEASPEEMMIRTYGGPSVVSGTSAASEEVYGRGSAVRR